jgi:hypothetical protein
MDKRILPVLCPSCGQELNVKRFECLGCGTAIEGNFNLPLLAQLSLDEQDFLIRLAQCSGSLKDLQRIYGVSYPTVRNRVDALIERINALQALRRQNGVSVPESVAAEDDNATENQEPV